MVYVDAPEGDIVNELPEQIEPLLTVKVGVKLTVTLLTAVFVPIHPKELVPVTEYDVLPVGVATAAPFEKVYVLAPEGTIVNEFPEQILPLFTEMVGEAFTVTLLMAVFELTHPFVPVPVTLNDVFVVGLTMELPPE
jgi:hypothetical protein